MVNELFFEEYSPAAPKPKESKLLYNINAILLTMQNYVLENVRKGVQSEWLDKKVFPAEIRDPEASNSIF